MALPEINRARIEALETEVDSLQTEFNNYDPVVRDESFENVTPLAPQNVRATALFRVIQVMWTYDTATYVSSYEVYASKNAGFTPTNTDLIWSGKAGAYGHPASLGETWYFRVRARNTHGVYSAYSEEVSAATVSIDGLEIDEQWQIDTVEYANQYTDTRELEIMTVVADKLDATVYHGQIILKANIIDVDAKTAELETAIGTKAAANSVYTITELDGKFDSVVSKTVYATDQNAVINSINAHETRIAQTETDISLRVTQTEYDADINDAANGLIARMSTAESSITANAGQIALRATQTELDTRMGDVVSRLDSAEAELLVQSDEIALRVTQTIYNDGMSGKEATHYKQNTAPAHALNRMWLDTSVVPNQWKRSTGTAWVKSSPTTAAEVGAYSTSEGSALATRVSTAESSITTNAGEIALRSKQSDLDSTNTRLSTAESTLSIQAGQISTKVEKDGVISSINQSAEQIKINAAKVTIDGDLEVINGLVKLKNLIVDKVHIKDGAIIERMVSAQVIANVINAGSAFIDFAHINNVTITNAMISALDAGKINTGTLDAARVRIGSASTFDNGFNPKLESFSSAKVWRNLAYVNGGSGASSTAIIRTGIPFGNYMTRVNLTGYVYNGGSETVDLSVGFYATASTSFVNTGYSTNGKTGVKSVRLGRDAANKVVIIVEFLPTSLSYPKLLVESAQLGHVTPPDSAGDGWSITLSADLTGITVMSTLSGKDFNETYDMTKLWQYGNTTYIDGGNIYADTVTANEINVASLDAISGTFTSGLNGKIEIMQGRILTSDYGSTYGSIIEENGIAFIAGNLYANSDTLGYIGLNSASNMEITTQLYSKVEVKKSDGSMGDLYAGLVDVDNLNLASTIYSPYGTAIQMYDGWLRLNSLNHHPSGIYTGSSLIRTDDEIQVGSNGIGYRIQVDGRPTTAKTEQGYFGTDGTGNANSANTAFAATNFRTLKTYTPSSISYTTMSTNQTPKFTDITPHGFLTYLTTSGASGFYYHRGLYTA